MHEKCTTGNNGMITGATTTGHNKDDRSQVQELLKNIKTKEVLADPGYDGENISNYTSKRHEAND